MSPASAPLTWPSALTSWQWDSAAVVVVVGLTGAYGWAWHRAARSDDTLARKHAWSFAIGVVLLIAATMSVIGVYDRVLFWVLALQVLLVLMVVPFFLAAGRPATVLRAALGTVGRSRLDRVLASPAARVLAHPAATSVAMLATPWLLYVTPWYLAALRHPVVGSTTTAVLLLVGFAYFYARLQTDPVPRRYSQLISLVISIVESLGDGLLGIVLWLGPLIAASYYQGIDRHWGPSPRVDQSIGAGILWIVGDVLGVGFIIVLMRFFSADERARAVAVDAELDRAQRDNVVGSEGISAATSGLWWEDDPQLRDRMGRRRR
jgi:cytochrome c oxidase assembly factor CtaG